MSECKRTPLHSPLYIPHLSSSAPSKPSPRSPTPFAAVSTSSFLLVPNTTLHAHTNNHTLTNSKQPKVAAYLTTSPMGRHGNEAAPSIVHTSSIALLQERFRNLQKVKEMREGRELQRVHAPDTDRALNLALQPAHSNEQPRWFLHPDLIRPSRPPHGPAYGLDANDGAKRNSSPPANSWGGMQNSSFRSDVDVDTSLHL